MRSNPKFEAPTWDETYHMLLKLARRIRNSGFSPEVIVGVSRGGWPPARIMSDLLENQNLANMKVVFYQDIGVRNRRPVITQPVTSRVKGKRILVVDDVSDTGLSLRVVNRHLRDKGASSVKVCTLYLKPASVFIPHFYARKTTKWVIFPWERLESIGLISKRLGNDGSKLSSLLRELKGSGVGPHLIRQLLALSDDPGKN